MIGVASQDVALAPLLRGQRALVVGASGGLGAAIAMTLARQGAALALAGRDQARLRDDAQRIAAATGVLTCAAHIDLADATSIERGVAHAAEKLGGLTLLVNAAGKVANGRFEATTESDWRASIDVKLLGTLAVIRAALPALKTSRGVILTISGLYGREPSADQIISGAINAALANSHKALAADLGPHGVRVLTLCIGGFMTPRLRAIIEAAATHNGRSFDEELRRQQQALPTGRFGEPDELAELIAFLASPRCPYLNGTSLVIDGGACHAC